MRPPARTRDAPAGPCRAPGPTPRQGGRSASTLTREHPDQVRAARTAGSLARMQSGAGRSALRPALPVMRRPRPERDRTSASPPAGHDPAAYAAPPAPGRAEPWPSPRGSSPRARGTRLVLVPKRRGLRFIRAVPELRRRRPQPGVPVGHGRGLGGGYLRRRTTARARAKHRSAPVARGDPARLGLEDLAARATSAE